MKTFEQLTDNQKLKVKEHFTAQILRDVLAGELYLEDESFNDEIFALWIASDYQSLADRLSSANPEVCSKLDFYVNEAAKSALYLEYGEHAVHLAVHLRDL